MKKAAIFTINDYDNYGNRLQNYAAQEVLKSLGFAVETVRNTTAEQFRAAEGPPNHHTAGRIQKLKETPMKEVYSKMNAKLWRYLHRKHIEESKAKRKEAFHRFSDIYIHETGYTISEGEIPKDFGGRYDYFITGSDQVWNPFFRYGSSVDFLTFAPREKRIAFSPSFGISEIPAEHIGNYRAWLSQIHRLSVREKAGARIIKQLTGRDAVVLVDPTLLLTKEQWLSVANPAPHKPRTPYLLTYFLGQVSAEHKRRIRDIAKRNGLTVIPLADLQDAQTYMTGPSEFLDYIRSASVFCTDSFHGVVFSMLLETPVIVFDRMGHLPSMNSRMDTLLSTFQLEARWSRHLRTDDQIFTADYAHAAPLLEAERKKAMDYLKEALAVKTKEVMLT